MQKIARLNNKMAPVSEIGKEYEPTFLEDPNANYKSLEQIAIDKLEGPREFVKGVLESVYGLVVSVFRLPTLARKMKNDQDLGSKMKSKNIFRQAGDVTGGIGVFSYSIYHTIQNESAWPKMIEDVSNFADINTYGIERLILEPRSPKT